MFTLANTPATLFKDLPQSGLAASHAIFSDGNPEQTASIPEHGVMPASNPRIMASRVNVFYGRKQALHEVSIALGKQELVAFIGPSGCGKSTFLRTLNRMNDTIDGCSVTGKIELDGIDIYSPQMDVIELRSRVGMVFQKPNPFPKSIYDNVAYGPRIHGMARSKSELDIIVESALTQAGLWNEVKDRLGHPALGLSGGQQQRLCIARAIAVRPEVILMDEPCSALDPIATATIESLLLELKQEFTIVVVTHSMQQAARISDRTAFFHMGKLIESGWTRSFFDNPGHPLTQQYLGGKFG